MPDPKRLTVSATQLPALFGASPYLTRWMLWQHMANGTDLGVEENERMRWGTKMQPLILEQAEHDLKLAVIFGLERYVRNGSIGCTRDAAIICPDRGPGALEVKCCFDYKTWMTEWCGGSYVPRHIEMQLQAQMAVGDGERSFEWGVVAVWVAAQVFYFERKPVPDLWQKFESEASAFLDSVRDRVEPDPFGAPMELPLLAQIYPTQAGSVLDLRDDEADSVAYTVKIRTYSEAKRHERASSKVAAALRAEMIAKLRGNEKCWLQGGASFGLGKGNRLNVYVPGLPEGEE